MQLLLEYDLSGEALVDFSGVGGWRVVGFLISTFRAVSQSCALLDGLGKHRAGVAVVDVLVLIYYDDVFLIGYGKHHVGRQTGLLAHDPRNARALVSPKSTLEVLSDIRWIGKEFSLGASFVAMDGLVMPHGHIGSSCPFPFATRSACFGTWGTCIGKPARGRTQKRWLPQRKNIGRSPSLQMKKHQWGAWQPLRPQNICVQAEAKLGLGPLRLL